MTSDSHDRYCMARALELARQGEGYVEPNPMVGCVISRDGCVLAEGWHHQFSGPHAEVDALQNASDRTDGATAYVTLEPCCHHGKTPPCTDALLKAGVRRVVVAMEDPFPRVAGNGIEQLRSAGVTVEVGLLRDESIALNAPFIKRVTRQMPWVLAKWAMTWDGKIAARDQSSRWISGEASRRIVHSLRGRMDAIVVGSGTVMADDPSLTPRPPGRRQPARVIFDRRGRLSSNTQLVQSASDLPVLVFVSPTRIAELGDQLHPCELLPIEGASSAEQLECALKQLAHRKMTNIMLEGGSTLFGAFADADMIDECHLFLAPKLLGGASAPTPIAGAGRAPITSAAQLDELHVEQLDRDLYLRGRIRK